MMSAGNVLGGGLSTPNTARLSTETELQVKYVPGNALARVSI